MAITDWTKLSLNLLAHLTLVALLSSCISHNNSAGNWVLPSTLPDGLCPEISGKYANIGQSESSSVPVYLYCELTSSKPDSCSIAQAKQIDQVIIDQHEDSLKISAWRSESMIASASLLSSQGAYLCKDGWITIESIGARGYGSSAAAFGTLTRSFAISQNHLLEKKRTKGLLLLSVLPIAGSTTDWYRYPPAEEPINSLQADAPDESRP